MTPKEKAKELVDEYLKILNSHFKNEAKQCALIAVDEIIENTFCKFKTKYWEEVRQEIENI